MDEPADEEEEEQEENTQEESEEEDLPELEEQETRRNDDDAVVDESSNSNADTADEDEYVIQPTRRMIPPFSWDNQLQNAHNYLQSFVNEIGRAHV